MLTKIFGKLLASNGRRTYLLGVAISLLGVLVAAGVLTSDDAQAIQALLFDGWEQIFGLIATLGGLAVVTQRAGGKADVAELMAQIEKLRQEIDAARESKPND